MRTQQQLEKMSNIETLEKKATEQETQINQLQQQVDALKNGVNNEAVLEQLNTIRNTILAEKEEFEQLLKQKDQVGYDDEIVDH